MLEVEFIPSFYKNKKDKKVKTRINALLKVNWQQHSDSVLSYPQLSVCIFEMVSGYPGVVVDCGMFLKETEPDQRHSWRTRLNQKVLTAPGLAL